MWEATDVENQLNELKLHQAAIALELKLDQATKNNVTYLEFLGGLLDEEISARRDRAFRTRSQLANLPFHKTLANFEFDFQPSINERQVRELASLNFIAEATNILLLGPPGVGKTHIAVALAMEALLKGISVYFTTAQDLVNELKKGLEEGRLQKRMRRYIQPKLLLIDEMGYLSMDKTGSTLFFQLISRRYEKGSIILTSNKSFVDWGDVLGDQVIATAILDRLLHHSITINIKGESYRLKGKNKARPVLQNDKASLN